MCSENEPDRHVRDATSVEAGVSAPESRNRR